MKKILLSIFMCLLLFNTTYGAEISDDDYYLKNSGYTKEEFQYLYNTIVKGIKNVSINEETFESVPYKPGINYVIKKAFMDYDHLNYVSGVRYVYSRGNRNIKNIYFEYNYIRDDIKKRMNEADVKADEVIKEIIKEEMTDFEKVVAVHDYIINNTRYDYEGFKSGKIPNWEHTAYGPLIRKTGVCDGYSKAFMLILKKLGIECISIKSDNHAWNMVKLQDKYYHVDLTFDDPYNEEGDMLSYAYFFIDDSEMAKDHNWNSEIYPKCDTIDFNYYKNNLGMIDSAKDETEFKEKITAAINNRIEYVYLKVDNTNMDIDKLIPEVLIENRYNIKISYSYKIFDDSFKISIIYN
ncbi:transglutaminase domain-containing protein [Anaeromicrobium sediminis]|uniref:Transglutaminase-like domain-containing protein n=1 Tax=Anaeromicrobium sediminis TaxID=1478221 RepID=A0A267MG10_9FIRM|nr:transglutaminase domain-containing protein [Anaeromicrobium sediminis]PAB58524.1 hypothetical protein CCE28_14555 [Anaeromicrobium sediminis]